MTNSIKKILFIEDEPSLQKTIGDVLSSEEFKLVSALDGDIGLRLADEIQPDLILLDLNLPELGGIDVLNKLKHSDRTKHIPVIILTNSEDMESIQEAIDLGATTYLVKINYKLEDIVEKIKATIHAG
jgi:two-component system, sensor histidine kinase and response regulator